MQTHVQLLFVPTLRGATCGDPTLLLRPATIGPSPIYGVIRCHLSKVLIRAPPKNERNGRLFDRARDYVDSLTVGRRSHTTTANSYRATSTRPPQDVNEGIYMPNSLLQATTEKFPASPTDTS